MTVRRLHLGDFHPDLEAALQRSLAALCPGGDARGVLVVVPNRLLGTHLRRRVAELGTPTLGLEPRTLEDLTEDLAAPRLEARGTKRLADWALPLLLSDLARRGPAPSAAAAGRPGWARALAATVRDLRDAGIEPGALHAAAREAGLDGTPRVSELVTLYAAFVARLRRRPRCADAAAVAAAAIESVRDWGSGDGSRDPVAGATPRAILVYGFYDLVGRQRDVLAALLADGERHAEVFFPWGAGAAFDYVEPLKNWFAAELGFEPWHETPALPYSDLLALRRRVFALPAAAPPANEADPAVRDGSVRWLSAPNESAEPLEVVRCLVDRPVDSSIVILRQREPAGERYRAAARAAGLRLHVAAGPLRRGAVGRAALSMLRLAHGVGGDARNGEERSLSRLAVEELLVSGGLSSSILLAESRPERWIQALRGRGLVAGLQGWRRFIQRYGTATESAQARLPFGPLGIDGAATRRASDGYAEDEDRERDAKLRRELPALADWIARLLDALVDMAEEPQSWSCRSEKVAQILAKWLEPGAERDRWLTGIRALAGLDGILPPTFAAFVAAGEELGETPGPGADDGARFGDAPTVAGLAEVRGVTAARIVLPGLLERLFPRRPSEDPILLDEERRRLNQALPAPLPLKNSDSLGEERLLFRLALSAARREVLFAWPRRGEDGRPLVPSSFLVAATAALLMLHVRFDELDDLPDVERIPLRGAERRYGAALLGSEADLRAIEAARQTGDPSALAGLVAAHPGLGPSWRAESRRRGRSEGPDGPNFRRLSSYDGLIDADLAAVWLGQRRDSVNGAPRLSPSALETYALCSFRFFHRHVLGLGVHAAPERRLDLDPSTTGAIYHSALRDLFARILAEDLWPLSDPARRERAEALVEPVLDETLRRRALAVDDLAPALWQAHRRRASEDLRRVLLDEARSEGEWRPVHLELEFRPERERPLVAGGVELSLTGRIDRVDEGPLGSRVVDYKTGRYDASRSGNPGSIRGGQRLQLPLYRLAYAARSGSAAPVHGAYRGVSRQSEFHHSAWEPEHFAAAERALAATLPPLTAGMAAGEFFQVERGGFCDLACDYRPICGPGRARLVLGKQEDPRAARAAEWRREDVEDVEGEPATEAT